MKEKLKYGKGHMKLWIPCIGMMLIFALVFYLYDLPQEPVAYGFLLTLVWILGFVLFEIHKERKKYRQLEKVKHMVLTQWSRLPKADTVTEVEYQQLVQMLFDAKVESDSSHVMEQSEMLEYYSLWGHQIKTPIAAIKILLQAGREHPETMNIKELEMELFKTEQYVEMVMSYLRMHNMSSDFSFQWYLLDDIVKKAIKKYARLFILQKISLQLDEELKKIQVLTDEKWLQFVIEQVLSNALKYTKSGSVTIGLGVKGELVIKDTGMGIWPEDLPRVFEKGFTGFRGREDKKSTGIGLYLCKTIMDKLEHSIWITSTIGEGTQVHMSLEREKLQTE